MDRRRSQRVRKPTERHKDFYEAEGKKYEKNKSSRNKNEQDVSQSSRKGKVRGESENVELKEVRVVIRKLDEDGKAIEKPNMPGRRLRGAHQRRQLNIDKNREERTGEKSKVRNCVTKTDDSAQRSQVSTQDERTQSASPEYDVMLPRLIGLVPVKALAQRGVVQSKETVKAQKKELKSAQEDVAAVGGDSWNLSITTSESETPVVQNSVNGEGDRPSISPTDRRGDTFPENQCSSPKRIKLATSPKKDNINNETQLMQKAGKSYLEENSNTVKKTYSDLEESLKNTVVTYSPAQTSESEKLVLPHHSQDKVNEINDEQILDKTPTESEIVVEGQLPEAVSDFNQQEHGYSCAEGKSENCVQKQGTEEMSVQPQALAFQIQFVVTDTGLMKASSSPKIQEETQRNQRILKPKMITLQGKGVVAAIREAAARCISVDPSDVSLYSSSEYEHTQEALDSPGLRPSGSDGSLEDRENAVQALLVNFDNTIEAETDQELTMSMPNSVGSQTEILRRRTLEDLKELGQTTVEATRPFLCNICGSSFETRQSWLDHQKLHQQQGKKSPQSKKERKVKPAAPVAVHRRVLSELYMCDVCGRKCKTASSLHWHQKIHDEKKHYCEPCGISFRSAFQERKHKMKEHEQQRKKGEPEECPICKKKYLYLKSHLTIHTDEKIHVCDICGKAFKTKLSLYLHIKRHTGKNSICEICGKGFISPYWLKRHHREEHEGLRRHTCEICGKGFKYITSYKEHMRRHRGEKPFVCQTCGRRFNNSRELKKHNTYHDIKSDFYCEECGMNFISEKSLKSHLTRTHNFVHMCEFCNFTSSSGVGLRKHRFQEHKDLLKKASGPVKKRQAFERVTCQFCEKNFSSIYALSKHLMNTHKFSKEAMKTLLKIGETRTAKGEKSKKASSGSNGGPKSADENEKNFKVYYKDEEMAVFVKMGNSETNTKMSEEDASLFEEDTDLLDSTNKTDLDKFEYLAANCQGSYIGKGVSGKEKVFNSAFNDTHIISNVGDNLENSDYVEDAVEGVTKQIISSSDDIPTSDENVYIVLPEGEELTGNWTDQHSVFTGSTSETVVLPQDHIVVVVNEDNRVVSIDGKEYMYVSEEMGTPTVSDIGNTMETLLPENAMVKMLNTDGGTSVKLQATIGTFGSQVNSGTKISNFQPQPFNIEVEKAVKETPKLGSISYGNFPISSVPGNKISMATSSIVGQSFLVDSTTQEETLMVYEGSDIGSVPLVDDKIQEVDKETSVVKGSGNSSGLEGLENALKVKADEFTSPADYNGFIDKMIQALQRAKR